MKTNWDVIVAGAGPAGAMAAMRLAAAGVDVLVLDRARFPRDKPCGGGLTPKAFRQLDFEIGDLVRQRSNRVYLKGPHLAPTAIAVTARSRSKPKRGWCVCSRARRWNSPCRR